MPSEPWKLMDYGLFAFLALMGLKVAKEVVLNLLAAREKDLDWAKAEVGTQRVLFTAALREMHAEQKVGMEKMIAHLETIDQALATNTRSISELQAYMREGPRP